MKGIVACVAIIFTSVLILGCNYWEELPCESEIGNERDRYAVAIIKDGMTIDHLPRKISAVFVIFEKREQYNLSHNRTQEIFLCFTV